MTGKTIFFRGHRSEDERLEEVLMTKHIIGSYTMIELGAQSRQSRTREHDGIANKSNNDNLRHGCLETAYVLPCGAGTTFHITSNDWRLDPQQ